MAYARAGCKSIVVLKKDGSVWWWGEYASTYSTKKNEPDAMGNHPCLDFDNAYSFNVFAQLKDGTIMAAGEKLGEQTKTVEITGNLEEVSSHTYSDRFVPVRLEEYKDNLK